MLEKSESRYKKTRRNKKEINPEYGKRKQVQRANPNIAQRGDAFTRICEAAPYSGDRDTNIRKAALEHVIQLSPELGTEKSANFLTGFLFDPSSEVCNMSIRETAVILD